MKPLAVFLNFALIILTVLFPDLDALRLIIVLQIIISSYYHIKGNPRVLSYGLVFFLLICLFHYGQLFLEEPKHVLEDGILLATRSAQYAIIAISAIQIGYFVTVKDAYLRESRTTLNLDFSKIVILRKFAKILFVVSFIPLLISDISMMAFTYVFGYEDLYSLDQQMPILKYVRLISVFAKPAYLLLIITYKDNERRALLLLGLFMVYNIIIMFSGARASSIIYILTAVIIYIYYFKTKIKFKTIALMMVIGGVAALALPIITRLRHATGFDVETITGISQNISDDEGALSAFLNEFGSTLISLLYAIEYTPGANLGLTYIAGFFNISPVLPSFMSDFMMPQYMFTSVFPKDVQGFLGGSCLGELYFNFGWIGTFFAFFIGVILSKMEFVLHNFNDKTFYKCICIIAIMPYALLWIRGFFHEIIYVGFWTPVLAKLYFKTQKVKL